MGDVVLDEHAVLEDADLRAAVLRAHDHLPVDGLAAREELGLGHDRATAPGIATVAAALLLGLEPRRPLDRLRLGDVLDDTLTLARLIALIIPVRPAATAASATSGAGLLLGLVALGDPVEDALAAGSGRKRHDLGRVEVQLRGDLGDEHLGQQAERHGGHGSRSLGGDRLLRRLLGGVLLGGALVTRGVLSRALLGRAPLGGGLLGGVLLGGGLVTRCVLDGRRPGGRGRLDDRFRDRFDIRVGTVGGLGLPLRGDSLGGVSGVSLGGRLVRGGAVIRRSVSRIHGGGGRVVGGRSRVIGGRVSRGEFVGGGIRGDVGRVLLLGRRRGAVVRVGSGGLRQLSRGVSREVEGRGVVVIVLIGHLWLTPCTGHSVSREISCGTRGFRELTRSATGSWL